MELYNLGIEPGLFSRKERAFPLQGMLGAWGVGIALVTGVLFWNFLFGFAFLVLFLCIGCLWHRDEPPVLPLCIVSQWFFIVTGYFYQLIRGWYPGCPAGNMDAAVLVSLIGLLVLVIGIRIALIFFRHRVDAAKELFDASYRPYSVAKLFRSVIIIYALYWILVDLLGASIPFSIAQIVATFLSFWMLFFTTFFLVVFNQHKGFKLVGFIFLFVLIPQFISYFAGFKIVFLIFIVAFLTPRKTSVDKLSEKKTKKNIIILLMLSSLMLLYMGLCWEGAIKPAWRTVIHEGRAGDTIVAKLSSFTSVALREVPSMRLDQAFEALAGRIGSPINFFSFVFERVPQFLPYEQGALAWRAISHALTPRVLFPEKVGLGSHSWLVQKYAGFNVAADEEGTSIAMGYMSEFYIDFGYMGMFGGLLLLGIVVGILYCCVMISAPSRYFAYAALIFIFLRNFSLYEVELAFFLGNILLFTIICGVLFFLGGKRLDQFFMQSESTSSDTKP